MDYLLASAKPLFKINFGHRNLHLLTDFQTLCCTYYDQFSAKYCWEDIVPPSKLSINYLRKFILRDQNCHSSLETRSFYINKTWFDKVNERLCFFNSSYKCEHAWYQNSCDFLNSFHIFYYSMDPSCPQYPMSVMRWVVIACLWWDVSFHYLKINIRKTLFFKTDSSICLNKLTF